MSENTCTSSKCRRRLLLSVIVFAFLCIAAAAIILVNVFVFFIEDCDGCSLYSTLLGTIAAGLFTTGLLILSIILCCKRIHINSTPQVVISFIPVEDLEKSPAAILPYNQVPRRIPFLETSSIDSLPDYFTVVQNPDPAYLSLDADVWTENVSETRPPSYEEAMDMTRLLEHLRPSSKSQENTQDFMQEVCII